MFDAILDFSVNYKPVSVLTTENSCLHLIQGTPHKVIKQCEFSSCVENDKLITLGEVTLIDVRHFPRILLAGRCFTRGTIYPPFVHAITGEMMYSFFCISVVHEIVLHWKRINVRNKVKVWYLHNLKLFKVQFKIISLNWISRSTFLVTCDKYLRPICLEILLMTDF